MTRFINAALITVLAFFVFMAIFWQMGDGADRPTPGGAPTVTHVEAHWRPAAEREMLIALTLHNPSSLPARATSLTYTAEVDGRRVDSVTALPLNATESPVLPGRGDGEVPVAIDLPDDFILSWWPSYLDKDEKAELRVQGSLAVQREDGARETSFEWRSSWQGDLAAQLAAAVENCAPDEGDVCIEEATFAWDTGVLRAALEFSNPGGDGVALRNMTLTLLFGNRTVVADHVDLARTVPPDGTTDVLRALAFSPAALEAWWPDHLARCERTPVAVRIGLEVEPAADGGDAATMQWTFPASTFTTRFVCSP